MPDRGDDPPTAADAVAECAATFDAGADRRLPNGIDRWNAYAGSCHDGD